VIWVSFPTGVDGATYYSYLLRMWRVPSSGDHSWRIQLENVRTGEKLGYSSLGELLAYLSKVTAREAEPTGEGK
jgi:hypothetical protein